MAYGTTGLQDQYARDIGSLCSAWVSGAQARASGFQDLYARELSTLLAPLSGSPQFPATNLQGSDGVDLCNYYGNGGVVSAPIVNASSQATISTSIPNPTTQVYWQMVSDGTCHSVGVRPTGGGGTGDVAGSWYTPNASGIGASYWVHYDLNIATQPATAVGTMTVTNGATGWTQISGNPTGNISMQAKGRQTMQSTGTCRVRIATDSGGANVVVDQTVSWQMDITFDG